MARKEVPEDEGPSQKWLASYADAMTLLMAFFIMMFAFALVDESKFEELKVGVVAALGIYDPATDNTSSILSDGTGIAPAIGFNPVPPTEAAQEQAEAIKEALADEGTVTAENAEELVALLETEFDRLGAGQLVDVGIDERGVYIRFDGQVLFASGQAELDAEGLQLLATSAQVLGLVDNHLEIEGHTDNQSTSGLWPSNWELSSARASRVVRWMIEIGDIPDPQLVAMGRADTRPRGDNATAEGRAQNRRVEIVVRIDGLVESDVALIDPIDDDPTGLDVTVDEGLDTSAPAPIEPPTTATEREDTTDG
ncbi:MAG: OmpA family protein [Acidimicrobiales bacterium]